MNYAIIAAGEGSRLAAEGITTPKPLVRLNGEPLIDRLIRIFMANGATNISVIVNHETDEVYGHLRSRDDLPLTVIRKSTPSSMHSFYELSHTIKGDRFCLTTVDTVFQEAEFARYIKAFADNSEIDGLMAVTDFIDDEKPLYVETDKEKEMNITGFSDDRHPDSRYVSGGVYCLTGRSLEILEASIEAGMMRMRNFQRELIRKGLNLRAWPFAKIIDVDHREDIRKAELFLQNEVTY
jgi:NDP-sugar pyrophosphorylase family protein